MLNLPSDRYRQPMLRAALLTGTIVGLTPFAPVQAAETESIAVAQADHVIVESHTIAELPTPAILAKNAVAMPETIAVEQQANNSLAQAIGQNIVKHHQAFTQESLSKSHLPSKQAFLDQTPAALHSAANLSIADATVAQVIAADDTESLRQQLLIEPLVELRVPGFAPGSTAGGPSAFGADFGDAYVGISGATRRARRNEADGSISAGFGLGDANKYAGLEVNLNIGSLRRFASNGDVGLKLHRNLSKDTAIAVGWDTGIRWGDENRNVDSTLYGVATKVFALDTEDPKRKLPLTVSVGFGGGRFRSFESEQRGRNTVGMFGSVGLQVTPQSSLVSTWTGRDLNLGISLVPIRTKPFFVTAVVANVFGRDDASTLYSLSLGYGFNFSGSR
jgi:hypothetical protein